MTHRRALAIARETIDELAGMGIGPPAYVWPDGDAIEVAGCSIDDAVSLAWFIAHVIRPDCTSGDEPIQEMMGGRAGQILLLHDEVYRDEVLPRP